jgi:topoisomerase-4 subunit A
MEQEAVVIAAMALKGGRKFLVASKAGNGFIVAEDESVANTRKGKQVLNLKSDEARALAIVEGDLIASIGENRKMLIFAIADIPEMSRGRGVRLQRFREKGLADVTTFAGDAGLTWIDSAGRSFTLSLKELKDWRGKRADAGRLAPKGFPKSNRFRPTVVSNGAARADEAD